MAVFAIVSLALVASVQATNPIAKVVQMLGDLEAKIVKEGDLPRKNSANTLSGVRIVPGMLDLRLRLDKLRWLI